MAEWSFPFTDVDGDRLYDDTDFAKYFAALFTSGVFATVGKALQIKESAGLGMRVLVSNGAACANGRIYYNDTDTELQVPVASTMQDRQDSIVVQADLSNRIIQIMYKQADTTVVRNASIYELQIAVITVPRNAVNITNSNIKDTRPTEAVCGYVSAAGKISTGTLSNQFQASYNNLVNQLNALMMAQVNGAENDREQLGTDWATWFANIQAQLDGDVAGNLQNQINNLYVIPTMETIADLNSLPSGVRYFSNTNSQNILNTAYATGSYWVKTVFSKDDPTNQKIQKAYPTSDTQGAAVFRTQTDGVWTDWRGYI